MIGTRWFSGKPRDVAELLKITGCETIVELGKKLKVPHKQNIHAIVSGQRGVTQRMILKIEDLVEEENKNTLEELLYENKQIKKI